MYQTVQIVDRRKIAIISIDNEQAQSLGRLKRDVFPQNLKIPQNLKLRSVLSNVSNGSKV